MFKTSFLLDADERRKNGSRLLKFKKNVSIQAFENHIKNMPI